MPVRLPPARLPHLVVSSSALAVALLLAGCESDRPAEKVQAGEGPTAQQDERKSLADDIAQLASGKDLTAALDLKTYSDAKDRLVRRGARIETTLIDNLRRSDDWGIRLGLVEVLAATGTRMCIDHLIAVLDDPQPLVALRANTLLVELTQHNEIPATGAPTAANGLPPVPLAATTDLALDADERQWAFWQREHGKGLRTAWASWWGANKDSITIK